MIVRFWEVCKKNKCVAITSRVVPLGCRLCPLRRASRRPIIGPLSRPLFVMLARSVCRTLVRRSVLVASVGPRHVNVTRTLSAASVRKPAVVEEAAPESVDLIRDCIKGIMKQQDDEARKPITDDELKQRLQAFKVSVPRRLPSSFYVSVRCPTFKFARIVGCDVFDSPPWHTTLTSFYLVHLLHRSHLLSNRSRALRIVSKPLLRTLPKKPRLHLMLLTGLLLPTLIFSRTSGGLTKPKRTSTEKYVSKLQHG